MFDTGVSDEVIINATSERDPTIPTIVQGPKQTTNLAGDSHTSEDPPNVAYVYIYIYIYILHVHVYVFLSVSYACLLICMRKWRV